MSKSQTEGTHNFKKLLPPIKMTFGDSALTCSININNTFVPNCQVASAFVTLGELKRGGASLIQLIPPPLEREGDKGGGLPNK